MTTHGSLYETITNDLMAELEQGVAPWVKPWTAEGGGMPLLPHNAASGHRYQGVNVLILWSAALRKRYRNPAWIGYHQAQGLGGHVRAKEQSTTIVYGSTFVPKDERDKPEDEQARVPFLKRRFVLMSSRPPACRSSTMRFPSRNPSRRRWRRWRSFSA